MIMFSLTEILLFFNCLKTHYYDHEKVPRRIFKTDYFNELLVSIHTYDSDNKSI